MFTLLVLSLTKVAIGATMVVAGFGLLIVALKPRARDWWSIGNSMGSDADWRI
jgi:hypothetical protein